MKPAHKHIGISPELLGKRVTSGFLWLTGQMVVGKGLTLLAQLLLAVLLTPRDFGLFSMAITANLACAALQSGGVRDTLIQRQRRFGKLVMPGTIAAILLGFASSAVMLAAIPFIRHYYQTENADELGRLVVVLAAQPLLTSVAAPSIAKLQIELRFKNLAAISLLRTFVDIALRISLAISGWGAMSFAVAQVAATGVHAALAIALARPSFSCRLLPQRVLSLIRVGLSITFAELFLSGFEFLDYAILSLLTNESAVGIYFLAYTLSNQVVFFFSNNVMSVLLPALAALASNRVAQARAQLRASESVALILPPACCSLGCLGPLLIRHALPPRWTGVSPLLQILSLGMIFRPHLWLALNLLKARGQHHLRLSFSVLFLIGFGCVVWLGAYQGGPAGAAIAVSLFYGLTGPALTSHVVGTDLPKQQALKSIYLPAIICIAFTTPAMLSGDYLRLPFLIAGLLGYVFAIRIFLPIAFSNIWKSATKLAIRL